MKRTVFFISDSTGITAEVMGEALLSHFPDFTFDKLTLPYISSRKDAEEAAIKIRRAAARDGAEPIVFDTLIDPEMREIVTEAGGFCVDVINTFLLPLEQALGCKSNYNVGRPKVATENDTYSRRIEAVHFALENDDGGRLHRYKDADIILIGVSRSGKTPTCLYLALQFGIFPANYPITEEDLDRFELPKALRDHEDKLFGLTIDASRLTSIRNERLSDSRYASSQQCNHETRECEALFERYNVPFIDTTHSSIEEISTRILAETGIERQSL